MHQAPLPNRLQSFGRPSVWLEFSPLAQEFQAVNLGQGFPGWQTPEFVIDAAQQALLGNNQYARSAGSVSLVNGISRRYSQTLNREIRANDEILVTVGASEAIYLSLLGLTDPGDEVILLAPAFDIYSGAIAMVGAKPVYVPLTFPDGLQQASDIKIDWTALRSAISSKTRAIILNTPHNPTGKVFSPDELMELADLLKQFPDITVISDEVYEHLVYDDHQHTPFASLTDMFERTLSIYSSGKTFSATGWKIGWVIGPKSLLSRLQICQQWVVFSVATPLQEAIAHCLEQAEQPYEGRNTYYEWLADDYRRKRDLLLQTLNHNQFNPIKPQGTFFILADIASQPGGVKLKAADYLARIAATDIRVDPDTLALMDYNFCRQLTSEKKVAAIPMSAFWNPAARSTMQSFARFAFCKSDGELAQASRNLSVR